MQKLSARQRTLADALEFSGVGVHSGAPVTLVMEPAAPDSGYTITRVYDDGRKVFIEFSPGIVQGEMPPLFVTGPAGNTELVNYRAYGNLLIVDRLFAAAELRLGGENAQKVRIVRSDGRSM